MTISESEQRAEPSPSRVNGILLFLTFLVYSLVSAPVPGVNEPHYLTKSKQYWDTDWCPGDLFLDSSNVHLVFYQTIGQLTSLTTLETSAWFGRVLALLLLAFGWNRLISQLVPGRWTGLWTAWTYLFISAIGSLSGEWLVGGVEAKVFSYAFVFWSLAFICEKKWNRAAISLGLAISFHPIVGVWSLLAGLFAFIIGFRDKHRDPAIREEADKNVPSRSRTSQAVIAAVLFVLCSLPGLVPAIGMLGDAAPHVSSQAAYIQVFYRLKHHLDPMEFSAVAYSGSLLLIAVWAVGRRWLRPNQHEIFLARFVLATILIALIGFFIGLRTGSPADMPYYEIRMQLLKFYPFRLFDVMLPIAAAVVTVGLVEFCLIGRADHSSVQHGRKWLLIAWLLFGCLLVGALAIPSPGRNPSKMKADQRTDWLDACRWISEETPVNALFFTPNQNWAFKWYANRAEYVSYKDCPQDAESLVEWNRRLKYLSSWSEENFAGRYSQSALEQLRNETGITHLIEKQIVYFDAKPIYQNRTYRVYRLNFDQSGN